MIYNKVQSSNNLKVVHTIRYPMIYINENFKPNKLTEGAFVRYISLALTGYANCQ